MIQFILSLLGLGNKLSRIQSSSDGALVTFKKALNKLKSVEQDIVLHHSVQNKAIADARKVKDALNNTSASNQKVIQKLEEFLS